jgi:hypothetical protein
VSGHPWGNMAAVVIVGVLAVIGIILFVFWWVGHD